MQALELGMHIKDSGYNIYPSGEANLGRTFMLLDFLQPKAKKAPTPPDLIYVHNFEDPDSPCLIELPAGQGRKLKNAMADMLARIRKDILARFENDAYTRRRSGLLDSFQGRKDKLFRQMDAVAGTRGFHLDMDDQGAMTLYPLIEGKRLSEQEFESLNSEQRKDLRSKGDSLLHAMTGLIRKLSRMEQDFLDKERLLEEEVASEVLDRLLTPLAEKFCKSCKSEALEKHFKNVREHILDNLDSIISREAHQPGLPPLPGGQPPYPPLASPHGPEAPGPDEVSLRCEVNLFVDNGKTHGAPIIMSDHPTPAHLLGSIERESELGALITDFTLIKAGFLHKANGGFLILRIEDLLQHPAAWEGMLRSLRSGLARIEDPGDGESAKTKGISPMPVPLSLKVILVGTEYLYESLLMADERFGKLFKIKAQLTEYMPRNARGIRIYLAHFRRIIEDAHLLPFDREAMAALVDAGSSLVEDQKCLSLKFPLLREIMIEASSMAAMRGKTMVDGETMRETMQARTFRANLVEESFMEEYDRKVIKVETSGSAVGRANGLSVTLYGDFEFGLPHQIAATVGAGSEGIIDLERESTLGGPIHTKAMLILKSYLLSQFARNKPLVLSGSLCFEQSYAGIEGDSASGAELAALLSALAGVPLSLSLAFTGAVSQSGQIMAVGGVTRKIEGFFEVCRRHGLNGSQGVLIPKDNIDHLMLKDEVLEAAANGAFSIYPVGHIREAMELLSGIPSGTMRKNGSFTPGSLYAKVDARLAELARLGKKKR